MVLASTANEAVKKFMDDFYLNEKGGRFLAEIDFSFNAHRKIAEGWVSIIKNIPGHIIISLECLHCDSRTYPMYFDGSHHETFNYFTNCLEICGQHSNPYIGKFRVCITPRETTW